MNIEITGMPIYYGCDAEGADLAYDEVKDDLDNIFKKNKIVKKQKIHVKKVDAKDKYKTDSKLKYVDEIMEANQEIYRTTMEAFHNHNFPIMIGGDHSGAMGTVSAALDYHKGDVSVIWVDAHLDIHTDEDTPSGNVHGIPLSVCIGRCKNGKLNIGNYKLNPTNLYYIGPRNDGKGFEIEEIDYVRKANVTCYMEDEVHAIGIDKVIEEIANKIKTNYVHISFDFDSITTEEFPSVNVLSQGTFVGTGGFTYKEFNEILQKLLTKLNVCSIDFVEYNPLLDKNKKDKKKVVETLKLVDKCIKG